MDRENLCALLCRLIEDSIKHLEAGNVGFAKEILQSALGWAENMDG